ncbi:UDP-N-acetylmuramyl pentapeptide phosphotransferase/UDP-N-acetylglucosamine-1-phosphate transferase [Rhodoplanes tepidamans]|nr:UDP-N-acetylmuramyl pentapeptide phosphotransferase/UDP-N-acetylglucosamine-1-phosphate transferase [Rhodoplanes tepidamans]
MSTNVEGPDVERWRLLLETGLPAMVGALAVTVALIVALSPLLRRIALARPTARSSHTVPTPQGGGIAVAAGAVAALAATAAVDPAGAPAGLQAAAVAAGVAVLAVTGFVDDVRPLPPGPRLVLQALAVGVVVAALPGDLRIVPALPEVVESVLLGLGLLWFVNLVNFMDGLDWMTVAQMVPMTAALAGLAALGALPFEGGVVALALLGALLGFAPFNRPVARLFLGDVGSLPLGLVTGWLLVLTAARGHLAAALLLPLYYVADATLTLGRRLLRGERVWEAHRTHFYQRAVANGLAVPQVVGRVALTNLVLAGLAVWTVVRPGAAVATAAATAGGAAVALLLADLGRPRTGRLSSRGSP